LEAATTAVVISLVVVILKIVWQATGNLFDWVIETFGNEQAVEELKRRRQGRLP